MKLPHYLSYDVLDVEGWPTTLDREAKRWALDKVGAMLQERGPQGLTLLETRQLLFDDPDPTRPPAFIFARMDSWEKALCYKILTTLETTQIWIPFELRKEIDDNP